MKIKVTFILETGHEETLTRDQLEEIRQNIVEDQGRIRYCYNNNRVPGPDFLSTATEKPFTIIVEPAS